MKTFFFSCPILVVATVLLAGCSTPDSRIKKNQGLFDTYPPSVQTAVRKGLVEPGFTEEMVYMALGAPDRKYTRVTATRNISVWSYTDTYTTPQQQRVEGSFRVKDASGHYRTVNDSVWVDVDQLHEYEKKRIEFEDGIVTAIEEAELQSGFLNPLSP
ncbi:MAG: hypothetical protein PHP44_13230 [Kiritimatiellae bacterium]|nr:hypothetical protein [Kiritimatiellia bacterium]